MNAFSATNFTDNSSDTTLQSSSSDKVVADTVDTADAADDGAGDGTDSQDNKENDNSDNTNTDDSKLGKGTSGGNGTPTFSFGNGSSFDFASLLDYFTKMMG